ncbi:MAG: CBS domain-containing protein [bacterium]
MTNVRDFMTKNPITISSESPIQEAARLMRTHDVGLLPVMENGAFRGVVTDRDIVVKSLADGRFDDTVGSIVSKSLVTLAPDDDAKKATELMSTHDVRRLPVCDGLELVGMVSVGDLATRQDKKYAGAVMEKTGPTS